jgi:hypothetical protein
MMANLPAERVTPSRPFKFTGLDYAGPFDMKSRAGRGFKVDKCYIALFVCFAIKAIHLELVTDMTTQACLAALRRFVARRNLPHTIFSDNGTNFVGCNKELRAFLRSQEHQTEFHNFCSNNSVEWKFNPPAAPHFGGLWEAGVKSVKNHLKRTITGILTYEEFSTLLTQIEACLNSRPLCATSTLPGEDSTLTPGHFLTGAPLLALPDSDIRDANPNRLTRWRHLQRQLQHFWQRWRSEYLSTLQPRKKWFSNSDDILREGDLVLLCDGSSPTTWPMAVVTALHPGSDGNIRVATVRTTTRTFQRPIVKLRKLPTNDVLNSGVQGGRDVPAQKGSLPRLEPSTNSGATTRARTRDK